MKQFPSQCKLSCESCLFLIFYTSLLLAKLSRFHWLIAQGELVLQSSNMFFCPDFEVGFITVLTAWVRSLVTAVAVTHHVELLAVALWKLLSLHLVMFHMLLTRFPVV